MYWICAYVFLSLKLEVLYSTRAGVTGVVNLLAWVLGSDPLQEQYVLLTAEPSLQLKKEYNCDSDLVLASSSIK